MFTINRPSMRLQTRAALAAAILLAGAAPAAARINFGSCTVDDAVGWDCSGKGGSLTCDGGVAYCCKSSGKGKDFVRICDELDQVIDLDIRVPTTTTSTLPRMLGFPRPLYKY